jgi:hypothetical protein
METVLRLTAVRALFARVPRVKKALLWRRDFFCYTVRPLGGHVSVPTTRRPPHSKSVCEDWIAWLPAEKHRVFDTVRDQLEISYTILSVALNEALTLRTEGSLSHACEEVGVTWDLFDRLAARLLLVLRALHDQGRNMPAVPNVTPLTPENFRGALGQRLSRTSSILSHILFSSRSKFLHKLHSLSEIAEELALDFRKSAEEVAVGASVAPSLDWETLDTLHYDINTCLRESVVVLKSFLLPLPDDDLRAFQQKMMGECKHPAGANRTRFASFRHRRATVI